MKNIEVARDFANGIVSKTENLFSERLGNGNMVIYSYGHHFPIAYWTGREYLFNTDPYSNSTSRHQTYVRRHLSENEILECDTTEILTAVKLQASNIVVIKRTKNPETITELIRIVKKFYYKKGVKRFQSKKWRRRIEGDLVLHNI